MKHLKIYMGYDSELGPEEAAVLIFAHNSKEARKLGWEEMRQLQNTPWTQMSVLVLRENLKTLAKNADPVKLAAGESHVVTDMEVCPKCGLFGEFGIDENGLCGYCYER